MSNHAPLGNELRRRKETIRRHKRTVSSGVTGKPPSVRRRRQAPQRSSSSAGAGESSAPPVADVAVVSLEQMSREQATQAYVERMHLREACDYHRTKKKTCRWHCLRRFAQNAALRSALPRLCNDLLEHAREHEPNVYKDVLHAFEPPKTHDDDAAARVPPEAAFQHAFENGRPTKSGKSPFQMEVMTNRFDEENAAVATATAGTQQKRDQAMRHSSAEVSFLQRKRRRAGDEQEDDDADASHCSQSSAHSSMEEDEEDDDDDDDDERMHCMHVLRAMCAADVVPIDASSTLLVHDVHAEREAARRMAAARWPPWMTDTGRGARARRRARDGGGGGGDQSHAFDDAAAAWRHAQAFAETDFAHPEMWRPLRASAAPQNRALRDVLVARAVAAVQHLLNRFAGDVDAFFVCTPAAQNERSSVHLAEARDATLVSSKGFSHLADSLLRTHRRVPPPANAETNLAAFTEWLSGGAH